MNFVQQPIDRKRKDDPLAIQLRASMAESAKNFKIAWINLAQGLFTVHRDLLFHAWGFDKFEDYVLKELGLPKQVANKLVKNYAFIENEEPVYLKKEFSEARDTVKVPGLEAVDLLRLAHRHPDISKDDYAKLRKDVFEKGKDLGEVKKDLTAMMKERKSVDPQKERENRHNASVRKLVAALKNFKKDMDALKLMEPEILQHTDHLLEQLESKSHAYDG